MSVKITKTQLIVKCNKCQSTISAAVFSTITKANEVLRKEAIRLGWDIDNDLCPLHKSR